MAGRDFSGPLTPDRRARLTALYAAEVAEDSASGLAQEGAD